jgi:hypothetical protein
MQKIPLIIISYLLYLDTALAISKTDIGFNGDISNGSILKSSGNTFISILTLIQSVLLKVVLPIIVVGASLYIAYELFTAEGDESKMKKAWKSVAYTAVALISIALSYGLVSIVSRISL